MTTNINDLVKKIKYFSDNNISINGSNEIACNSFRISSDDREYKLSIYDNDHELDLYSEINYNLLKKIGANPIHTYEIGIFDDINKTYILRDYRDEISLYDYLVTNEKNSNYKLGYKFGEILKNLHQLDHDIDLDWYKDFNTKSNYLFYLHGVNEVGDDDYILIDYINGHKHLTKNLNTSFLYQNLNYDHVFIGPDESINLEGLDFTTVGDPAFDFPQINKIAIVSEEFAKGCLDGYFKEKKAPLKFFRLLSLYQAYEILKSMVQSRSNIEPILSDLEIKYLLDMYDNFNEDVPNWT